MDTRISPGSIVVAVDGSEHGERALAWATEQAALEDRTLVTVAVGDPNVFVPTVWAEAAMWEPAGLVSQIRAGVEEVASTAADTARELRPDVTVQPLPLLGEPRDVLIDLSRVAHLLVLGSRGRGPVRSMLLGSVSTVVSKHAACPVVVVRPPSEHTGAGVVVGADGTPESVPVIEYAFDLASRRKMPLTVLHCYWDAIEAVAGVTGRPRDEASTADQVDLKLLLAESVAGAQERFPDVDVRTELAHGLVDEVLVRADAAWDVVVVGRHPRSLRRVLVGSIATAVVERARTTVVVVPEAVDR